MTETLSRPPPPRRSVAKTLIVLLQRIISIYCLVFGILYWSRIVGFPVGGGWRFDLMPVHWQVASVVLAAFYPFAAIGLWMLAPWGPVIWLICAGTEIAMFEVFTGLFGRNLPIVASHAVTIAFYIVLRVTMFMQARKAAVSEH